MHQKAYCCSTPMAYCKHDMSKPEQQVPLAMILHGDQRLGHALLEKERGIQQRHAGNSTTVACHPASCTVATPRMASSFLNNYRLLQGPLLSASPDARVPGSIQNCPAVLPHGVDILLEQIRIMTWAAAKV